MQNSPQYSRLKNLLPGSSWSSPLVGTSTHDIPVARFILVQSSGWDQSPWYTCCQVHLGPALWLGPVPMVYLLPGSSWSSPLVGTSPHGLPVARFILVQPSGWDQSPIISYPHRFPVSFPFLRYSTFNSIRTKPMFSIPKKLELNSTRQFVFCTLKLMLSAC